jgi:predicted Zn-dependent protease
MRELRSPLAWILASSITLAGCAINPATGKRQLMLISERQEIELGRENDRAVVSQMGLYDDPELAAYVAELGRKLAATSERPDFDWTFRVVDDPVVNAFALPGGYIYVTRGIMAHFDDEAELVGVLGHEIGHVTARHSANQLSKAQLAQVGLAAATVLAPPEAAGLGDLAGQGLGLLFLKFGRDDERQADELGVRYMRNAGYDPRPMIEVFRTLERVGVASGAQAVPNWMSTHPAPENRAAWIEANLGTSDTAPATTPAARAAYLERLDGVVFGNDPREGFFRGNLFLHPGMDFQLAFPQGWKTQNTKQAVLGAAPRGDAIVGITLTEATTPQQGLDRFFSEQSIARKPPEIAAIHGKPTAGYGFRASTEGGVLAGVVAFVGHGNRVFQLIGYAAEPLWPQYEAAVRSTVGSFQQLADRSAKEIEPARVSIVKPTRSMSPQEFAEAFDASVAPETLALINQLDEGDSFLAGVPYKVVRGGE